MQKCESCIETKTQANTHCRCAKCGFFRPLTVHELAKVSKRASKGFVPVQGLDAKVRHYSEGDGKNAIFHGDL